MSRKLIATVRTPVCPSGCGKCCDPVTMPVSRADVLQRPPPSTDEEAANRDFILNVLVPMSRREGILRAPHMNRPGMTMALTNEGDLTFAEIWYYSCPRLDPETKLCSDYDNRPPLCRDYPPVTHHEGAALPEGCVFT